MRVWIALGTAVATWLFPSRHVVAQSSQRVAVQLSGLYAELFGKTYDGLGGGLGFEAQLRYTPGALSIGAGYQRTTHHDDAAGGDVHLSGGFLEPRYVIATSSTSFIPYVSARVSLLSESYDISGFSGSASGSTINAGGGVLFRLGARVNLDAGATYGYTKFGDTEVTNNATGETFSVASGSGSNVVLRLGVAIGLIR